MLSCGDLCSPQGVTLHLVASDTGIRKVEFGGHHGPDCRPDRLHPLVAEALRQLGQYFAGRRREFDLPLEPRGTAFQLRVWRALQAIPYGETRSYAEIARAVGSPRGFRAVGAANGQNPIAIVVPCHRVIASSGALQGFGGGLEVKRMLLDLEARARSAASATAG